MKTLNLAGELDGIARRLVGRDTLEQYQREEMAGPIALAALLLDAENQRAPEVPAPVPAEEPKPPKKKASGAKGGRPRGVPCPANESGRHNYGDDGKCKNCPASKSKAVAAEPAADVAAVPEAIGGAE